mgnify:CR=1 FL=1
MKKWAKETKSQKQKDREEKDILMAEITKLKIVKHQPSKT